MPGRLILTTPVSHVARALGVSGPDMADMQPRYNMQPGQDLLVLGPDGLSLMRWDIIPVGRVNARGRPVMETIINARSETLFDKSAFGGVGRAVVPADGWYEWTGKTRRKTAWRIASGDGGLLFFAAISDVWTAPNGAEVKQVATVTCEPNADVRQIHHRMGVLLRAEEVPLWFSGAPEQVRDLLNPWPDGQLHVEKAEDVDWTGA